MRTAIITTVRRQHDEVIDQVAGISLGTRVPDLHVVVALADRTVTQGRLPITSDRWETIIDGLPTVKAQLPTAVALRLGVTRAVESGAELLVLADVTCIPGPRLLERLVDRVVQGAGPGPVLWAPVVQRLRPPPPEGYEFARLQDWVRCAGPVLPPPPGAEEVRVEPDGFCSSCLAITTADLASVGGLCPDYVGGSGHDTDLAAAVTAAGGSVRRLSGATAYRRHQPTQLPEKAHLASVTRNAHTYRERWGRWPEAPWLTALVDAGMIDLEPVATR